MVEPRGSAADGRERLLDVAAGRAVAAELWRMLRGHRMRLAGIVLLFVIEAATAIVFPLVVGSFVDTVVASAGTGVPAVFWWQLAVLVSTAGIAGLLTWAGTVAMARLAETLIARLREAYVAAALHLPRATIEKAGTGDVVTRASDDIARVSGTLPQVLPRVAVSGFTIVFVGVGLGALDPRYLAGFAITIPLYASTVRWYLRIAPAVYSAERAAHSQRGQHILGTLTQQSTVAAHGLHGRQLNRVRDAAWQTVRWAMRTRIVQNRLFGRLNLTEAVGLFAVVGIGIWLAFAGSATAGEVTAAALLFLRTVAPIAALLTVMDDMQSALAALGRLVGVIHHRPAPPRADDTSTDAVIAADGVTFSYDGRKPALSDVSLRIDPGEIVAVVGSTGSGKSTLAGIIAGIHHPDTGKVRRRVPEDQVVTITQETHVFAATVRDNLSLAAPNAADEALRGALGRVGVVELAHQLPQELDTVVGHGGHSMAPAFAQHVALARVLLADPAVVVLDEATAEADAADAAMLDRAAEAVTQGRAALVIAHRLSQAAAADRVVVVEAGRIVETGTHEGLVAAGGVYARLWQAWNKGRTGDAVSPSTRPGNAMG